MSLAAPSTTAPAVADFLDQDPQIRGQNFACVSFISPEDVLQRKDVFQFTKFLGSVSADIDAMLVQLEKKYEGTAEAGSVSDMVKAIRDQHAYLNDARVMKDEFDAFVSRNAEALERDFAVGEGSRTTIRGFKIRGVYDTLDEAKARAMKVRGFDDKFNVYVAQVGCWCPWSPNPEEISDSEYAESHLNNLMKSYKLNEAKRTQFYEQRKSELITGANARAQVLRDEVRATIVREEDVPADASALPGLDGADPWLAQRESASA